MNDATIVAKARMGRPSKPPEELTVTVSIKVKPELKQRLKEVAKFLGETHAIALELGVEVLEARAKQYASRV